MSQRKQVLAKLQDVPQLPTTATQIIQLLRTQEFSITELQKLIELSPSIAANVLKMANTAFYAGPKAIGSIREAVMRLGSHKVYDIVLTTSVAKFAGQPVSGYDLSPGALWTHSVMSAITVQALAKHLNLDLGAQAFTAALLHDIGKIVMGDALQIDITEISKLAFEENLPFEVAERQVLGIDHAEVGAELLKIWQLPEDVIEIVRWHHTPDDAKGGSNRELDVVHIANIMVMLSGLGRGRDGQNYKTCDNSFQRLGMNTMMNEVILSDVISSLEELKQTFQISFDEVD